LPSRRDGRLVLAGGDLVLPDRVIAGGSLLIDADRIAAVDPRASIRPADARVIDVAGTYIVPGFIDVHVHGVEGFDTLDSQTSLAAIAARLPRYGVTAFCPTTVACDDRELEAFLAAVRESQHILSPRAARVLPAHLESNFINPQYCGAQPMGCLRAPRERERTAGPNGFTARDILNVIAAARREVGIVTIAPELTGGVDLVRDLVAAGHRVSLGHSGADFDTAIAAIEAGARHGTHLFNRMAPMTHRAPGLAGAILARDEVTAELICDGYHVHPSMCELAIRTKRTTGIMAITDATAGAGLPVGATARLGGRTIRVTDQAAVLEEGTLAGSTLTMDRAFRNVVTRFGRSVTDAAAMCATTPATALGLAGIGAIREAAIADLVVLDRDFAVVHTVVAGELVYSRS
jgi:N-acetylglucosamine-6-phosphate deacetylase